VSLEEWVYIIKSMQQIRIDSDGQVQSVGEFKKTDADEKTNWVRWNQQREAVRQRRIQNLLNRQK
jgi:hypothetical protein